MYRKHLDLPYQPILHDIGLLQEPICLLLWSAAALPPPSPLLLSGRASHATQSAAVQMLTPSAGDIQFVRSVPPQSTAAHKAASNRSHRTDKSAPSASLPAAPHIPRLLVAARCPNHRC